jgi:hypothetical protein
VLIAKEVWLYVSTNVVSVAPVVLARLLKCCERNCCTSVCAIAVQRQDHVYYQLTSGPGMFEPPQAVLLHAMKGRTKLNLHPYKNARRPAVVSSSNATECTGRRQYLSRP